MYQYQGVGGRNAFRNLGQDSALLFFFFFFNIFFFSPDRRLNLYPLQWKLRVLTTGSPEKPQHPALIKEEGSHMSVTLEDLHGKLH